MRDRMEEISGQLKPGGVDVSRVNPLVINWITFDSHFDYLTFSVQIGAIGGWQW